MLVIHTFRFYLFCLQFDDMNEFELENGLKVAKQVGNQEDQEEEKAPEITVWEILKMNRSEWHLIVLSSLASMLVGATQPMFSILLSEIIGVCLCV